MAVTTIPIATILDPESTVAHAQLDILEMGLCVLVRYNALLKYLSKENVSFSLVVCPFQSSFQKKWRIPKLFQVLFTTLRASTTD